MVDHINRNRRCHIMTTEDPIEFVHEDSLSIKWKDGRGRAAASETLVAMPAIRNMIREGKTF